jgi:Flp pilus assembly protein TadD
MQLRQRCLLALMAAGLATSGCAQKTTTLARQQCINPDVRLSEAMRALEAEREGGCTKVPSGCDTIPQEIERLALVCSRHTPTMMAAAVLAYEDHQPVRAEQWLDVLLSLTPRNPDAAGLRARIAIEEGNLPYALRMLEQHIALEPSHPGLQETLGAALYLSGRFTEAQLALARAERLGAPHWRVAYDLALVAEARGEVSEARRLYREALNGRPAWSEAESRLKGLGPDVPAR